MFIRLQAFFMAFMMCFLSLFGSKAVSKYKVAAPKGTGTYTKEDAKTVDDADYYVAADGNDNNDGTFENPF